MDEFREDLAEIASKCIEKRILLLNNVGYDLESSRELLKLSLPAEIEQHLFCGIHPHYASDAQDKDFEGIIELLSSGKFDGIGEIGLDRYWYKKEEEIERQKKLFIRQMDAAAEKNVPVMLHVRDAYDEAIEIASGYKGLRVLFHSFLGSRSQLDRIISNGWYFGVNGVITFKNSQIKNTVRREDFGRMVIETDAPYLSPAPHRGKRNSPLFVTDIYRFISEFYGYDIEELKGIVYYNFGRFLKGG